MSVATLAMFVACSTDHKYTGTLSDPVWSVPGFELIDQDGKLFSFGEDAERLSMVFFGYALCPDVCPTTLADMVRVKQQLDDSSDQVRFVWITVDPDRDSPKRLKARLEVFDPTFIALSGSRESLEQVWQWFRVQVEVDDTPSSAAGFLISHTANTYLVGADGTVHVEFPFGADTNGIASDIKQIIKQTERPNQ